MKRRTRKLLIVLVAGPLLLAGLGAAAYTVRQSQNAKLVRRSLDEGRAAFDAGQFEKALPLLARYVGRNRENADALLMLAQCRARVPKPDGSEIVEAARYASAAIDKSPNNERALELLVDYYSQANFITELGGVCDQLLALHPDHAAALTAKAQSLIALGRYDQARQSADRLVKLEPSDVARLRLLLEIRRLQGALPRDLAAETEALTRSSPQSFELQVIHAQMLARSGELDTAFAAMSRAAALKPATLESVADYLRLCDVISARLRIDISAPAALSPDQLQALAATTIDAALADPRLARGAAAIAAARDWRRDQYNQARAWTDRGLEAAPSSVPLLAWRAIITRSQGGEWEAEATAVRQAEAGRAPLWSSLLDGLRQADRGEWDQADATLAGLARQANLIISAPKPREDPEADQRRAEATDVLILATLQLGFIHDSRGDWRLATQTWLAAGELEPGWSRPFSTAAATLLEHGQVRAAFEQAIRAFRIRSTSVEGLILAKTLVARDELEGPAPERSALLMPLLAELESRDLLRGEAICLRIRAAAARADQPGVRSAVDALGALPTLPPPGLLIQAAQRIRAAGLDGWQPLLAAADSAGPNAESTLVRAADAANAGRRDEALGMLRTAAASQSGPDALPFRFAQARILADTGSQEEAREILRDISAQHPKLASAQMGVLDQPVAWTDAALIESAVQRLRASTGERGIEWRLAEATRLLTFHPEPAKAQEVVVWLTRIVRDDPRNAQALTLLSEWMLVLKDESAAVEYLTRAVDAPDSPPSLYPRLIDLLKRTGRRDDARARLQQFAEVPNITTDLRRARARLLTEFRLPELARKDLEALAAQGAPDDQLTLAAVLLAQGQTDAAIKLIDSVLAQPGLPRERLLNAAMLLVDAGQPDRALSLLDSRSDPATPSSSADRARLLERAGRLPDAEQALRQSVKDAQTPDPYVELARFLLRRSHPDQARETVAEARARGLTSKELDAVDAVAISRTQTLTPTQQQSVIESIPAGPARDLAEAAQWFDQNSSQKQEFINRLRKITAAGPELVLAWQFLVRNLIEIGDVDQALAAARAAASANPRSAVAARLEATTLLQAGPAPEARAAAQRWQSLSADPLEPAITLARIEIREGRTAAAAALLDPLADRHRADARDIAPELWASLVSCYAQIGSVKQARDAASRRDPNEPGWSEAMARIAGAEAIPPDAAREWLESLRPTLSQSPDGPARLAEAFTNLAYRSKSNQDFLAAIALLEPLLASEQPSADELILAASLYEETQRPADAEVMYRRALRKAPDHWVAMNNLAYLLLQQKAPAKESLSLARRASELAQAAAAPPAARASTLQTLAIALLRAGQNQEALETVRRAIALDRTSGEAALTEAEALEATGDKDRAKAAAANLLRQADAKRLSLKDTDRSRAQELINRLGG